MSDGLRLNPGQDGELLKTKDTVSGHYQQILVAYLAGGIPVDVDATNKLPVVMDLSTLSTHALQTTANTKLTSIISALAPLATQATLATRLSETTGAAIRDAILIVSHDPNAPPLTANTPKSYLQMGLGDSPSMDSFCRLRVSNPHTRFDSSQVYEKDKQFDEILTAGGTSTFNANRSAVQMATTTGGDAVVRQSFEFVPYQPGKSQLVYMTFVAYDFIGGVTSRIGVFDGNNGIFFKIDTGFHACVRTESSGSPVDTEVAQVSWNLDPMDGSGPSGLTINIAKIQIAIFDYEWLGAGRIRMGFVIDGLIHYVHEFNTANIGTMVWGLTGHLPVRMEITQSGATAGQLDQICSSVISEGGEEVGEPRSYGRTAGMGANNTSWLPLISLRPKLLYQTLQNRKSLVAKYISAIGTTAGDLIMIQLVWGCALTGATFAIDPGTPYAGELDIAATAVTGGIVVASGQAGDRTAVDLSALDILSNLKVALNIAAAHPTTPYPDVLCLQVRSIAATATVVGSLGWIERGP